MSKIIFTRTLLTPEEMYGAFSKAGASEPSLGLCYLAAATRRGGFETEIIDSIPLGLDCVKLAEAIVSKKPKYVGISSVTLSIYNAAKVAELIKEKSKDITVIIGGVHITAVPEETMGKFFGFDIGVIGEGETTICELLRALEDGSDLEKIRGLIFRKDGVLVKTAPRLLVKNLDDLAYPAWDLLPDLNKFYHPPAWSLHNGACALLILTRGCAARCIYCDRGAFGNMVRAHSVDYAIQMLVDLRDRYGIRQFRILDDNFVLLKKHIEKFCRTLIENNLKFSWSCFARADCVNPELLKLMRKAGCWQISYGIETGSQELHDLEKKNIGLREIEQGMRWTKEAGISTVGFTMIAHPGETPETVRETVKFCCRLALDDFKMVYMTPYPSTEIFRDAEKYGTLDRDWRRMNAYLKPCFVPHGMTAKNLISQRKMAYIRFYLRPKIIYSYLGRIKSPRQFICLLKGAYSIIRLFLGFKS